MRKPGIEKFKYYVGSKSLADLATKDDRICVLNITGNESRAVTPVSHAYSGGNVVFGTSPGRGGQFVETPAGKIPVYNNVREGMVIRMTFLPFLYYALLPGSLGYWIVWQADKGYANAGAALVAAIVVGAFAFVRFQLAKPV